MVENKIIFGLKSFFGAIGTIWSFIVGTMGWAFPSLVIMMLADFVSGLIAGSTKEGLSSAKGRKGFVKKVHVLIIIGAVYLMEKAMFNTSHVGDGVTLAYLVIEFISLVENAGKLGAPIGPVKNFIAVLKQTGDDNNGKSK